MTILTQTSRAALIIALLSGIQTAWAQASDQASASDVASGEIIVTAQKREQSLQKVPVSIEVVSADLIAARNVSSTSQLATVVQGFEFVRSPNQIPGLTFRGIGPQSGNIAFDSSIGMFVDGVFMGNVRLYNQTLFDVQRAELIRGGQGTILGKNTTIGALSITNAKPGDKFGGRVEVGGEVQNGGYFGDIAVNLPASDTISFRLSGRYSHSRGWLKNLTTGLQGPQDTSSGIRAQMLFKPGNGFEALLSYQHTEGKTIGSSSQISNLGPLAGSGLQGAGPAIGGATYGTNVRRSFASDPNFSPSDPKFSNGDDYLNTRTDVATATLSYDLGGATITSITSGAWYKFKAALDFDFNNKDASVSLRDEKYSQFTQELRIASDDSNAPFQYLAGLYYINSTLNIRAPYKWGIPDFPPAPPGPCVSNPAVGAFCPGDLFNGAYDVRLDQKAEAYAGFGQITFKPTDALSINLGARYSHERKKVSMGSSRLPGPVTFWNTFANAPFAYQALTPTTDDLLSGSVSLQYQISPNVMSYASYSRGGKAGGYGDLNSFGFDPAKLGGNPERDAFIGKERSNSYEVGLKTRLFDRKATLNVAGFLMDLYGLQQLAFTGAFVSTNDRVRAKGVEGSFEVKPDPHWSLGFSATYSDVLDLNKTKRIAQSPRFSGTAHIDYGLDVADGLNLSFGAAVRHRSSKFNQLNEAEFDKAFTTLGLHVRLESEKGWFVNANAENVTNSYGADFGYPGPDPFVQSYKTTAPLRSIWISAGTKF